MYKIFIPVDKNLLLSEALDQKMLLDKGLDYDDDLNESLNYDESLNEIKSFVTNLKQSMFKMKFPTLSSVPAKIKEGARNFSKIKFLSHFPGFEKEVTGVSKYFLKYTNNEYLRLALGAAIVLKAKATKKDVKNEVRLMEQKYDNMNKRIKVPAIVFSILLISLIWAMTANTLSMNPVGTISKDVTRTILNPLVDGGQFPIPMVSIILIALVAGIYYYSDTDEIGYVGTGENKSNSKPTVYTSTKNNDSFSL